MDVLLPGAALILGILFLIKGSDWIVISGSNLGQMFRIKPIFIALTVIAFGTSLPEFSVSTAASIKGNSGLALGNVIGSCIANILLIMGLSALIRPIKVEESTIRLELPMILLANLEIMLVSYDKTLSRLDGALLFLSFLVMFAYLAIKGKNSITSELSANQDRKDAWKEELKVVKLVFKFIDHIAYTIAKKRRYQKVPDQIILSAIMLIGILFVIGGAEITVESSVTIAKIIKVPEFIIALTIISIGTSLPELFISSWATYKNQGGISIGNAMGSNLFNILFILSVALLITPIALKPYDIKLIIIMAVVNSLVAIFIITEKTLSRTEGSILLGIYTVYIYWVVFL